MEDNDTEDNDGGGSWVDELPGEYVTAESLLDQLPKEEQLALLQGQGVKAGTSSLRAVLDTPTGGAKYLNMESQMDFADNESGFQDQEMNAMSVEDFMEAEWDFTDDLPHTDEFGVTRRNATQKEIPEEHRDPWEPRIEEYGEMEGRVEYEDGFHVGQVVEGIVEALTERQGIFVDVGADYDANVFVDEFDWDKIAPLINIDQKVKIKITNVLPSTYGRFVMPLEAQLLEPDISQLLEAPPRLFPPVYFDYNNEDDTDLDAYAFAMQAGRPVGDFPIDYNDMIDQLHEKELAEEEARKKAMKMRGEALDEEMLDDDTDVTDDLLSEPAAEDDDAGLGSDLIVDEEDFN